jgi:hypothetical protein
VEEADWEAVLVTVPVLDRVFEADPVLVTEAVTVALIVLLDDCVIAAV